MLIFNRLVVFCVLLNLFSSSGVVDGQCGGSTISSELLQNENIKNKWPWLAAMFSIEDKEFFCGGTIVSTNHILTAAHCTFNKRKSQPLQLENVAIFLGKHDLNILIERGTEIFYPVEVKISSDSKEYSERSVAKFQKANPSN